ncbi:hypothetical protein DFJ77DRAFT_330500 [Powellomyces hirtus]|nr:hypothetical protein DFJ77DRAFT_330500 [Powellomyces hirtus]
MDLSLVGAVLPRPTTTTVGVNGNSSGNNEGNHHHGNALGNHDGRANHHGNVNVRLLKKYKYKRATRYRPASIATEAPLSAHVSQTQSFRCGDCNENFKSSTELLEHHARLHTFSFASCHFTAGTGNGTHPEMFCQQCSRSFANARAFEEHTRTHMALSHPHRCQICPPSHASAFTTEALLNAHVSSIHPFRCGDCNAHFDSPAGLLEHNTRLHTFSFTSCEFSAGTANGRLEPSQGTARFPCPQCAQEFLTDALRTQHLAVHRFESGPRESTTGGTSSREANNDVSSLTHALRAQNIAGRELGSVAHQSTNRGTTSGGANASLVCGECFEVSADAAALQEHINNCHLHICSFCQERVGSFREFEAHMLRKHSYYPCGICKLSFPHELARNLHTCPICTICKDSSPTMITLVHHMESTHHVFPCPYCLAHFQRPRNLTAHVENCPHRRLTDRHTYSCRVCGAFFDRQEELGRHVTRQHHPCTSCDAGPFGSVWAL